MLPRVRDALGERATLIADSRYRLGEFVGLDGATPNEEEAEALLGAAIDDDPDRLEQAGREPARAARRALPPDHPRQPRDEPVPARSSPPTCPSRGPTRWRTSPAPAIR